MGFYVVINYELWVSLMDMHALMPYPAVFTNIHAKFSGPKGLSCVDVGISKFDIFTSCTVRTLCGSVVTIKRELWLHQQEM